MILLTQVVSAQFFGGYGRFSITDFFSSIEPATITLGLLFFIFFALIFYVLSRVFKDQYGQPNKGIAGTISLALSLLIIYGLYRTGFDLGNIFYNLGFSVGALYPILSVLFLIIAILLIRKLRFSGFLILFGLFIILLTIFTDIFYEKLVALTIGVVLFLIGVWLWRRGRRMMRGIGRGALRAGKWVGSKYDWEKEKKQAKAIGRGVGKGVAWGGKTAWKGAKGVGRGIGGIGGKTEEPSKTKFQYSQEMRRGGLKPTRGRFASKKTIERYARRFGTEAARRRFG